MKKQDVKSAHDQAPTPAAEIVPGPVTDSLESYLALVNELLPRDPSGAMGAYCMGMSAVLAESRIPRMRPTRELLLQLRACSTAGEGTKVMADWMAKVAKGGAW